jgi:uncharacterized protein YndB with AHSA1/START domain
VIRSSHFLRAALGFSLLVAAPAWAQSGVAVQKRVEADGTHTLVHEVVVDAPAREVWAAISTADGWKSWAVPVARVPAGRPDILETSYDPAAKPGDAGAIHQQFLAKVPERLLVFRTVKAPDRFPHWESYKLVTSVFELEPAGSKEDPSAAYRGRVCRQRCGQAAVELFRKGEFRFARMAPGAVSRRARRLGQAIGRQEIDASWAAENVISRTSAAPGEQRSRRSC